MIKGSSLIPALRYQDAPAMIDWLCKAFGFKKHAVHANDDGTIGHAQLTLGQGMIMLGSVANGTPYSALIRQPAGPDWAETQSPYIAVEDCDAVYEAAKAAGATMIFDIADQDYGGRGFTCRDPEGHLWSVGSYDPWSA
jgi:uncharacterized glyoxalase superfamily protein PhnB